MIIWFWVQFAHVVFVFAIYHEALPVHFKVGLNGRNEPFLFLLKMVFAEVRLQQRRDGVVVTPLQLADCETQTGDGTLLREQGHVMSRLETDID